MGALREKLQVEPPHYSSLDSVLGKPADRAPKNDALARQRPWDGKAGSSVAKVAWRQAQVDQNGASSIAGLL